MTELDAEQLRQKLQNGEITITSASIPIEEGVLLGITPYIIEEGWSLPYANQCDQEWQEFYIHAFEYINKQNYSDAQKEDILNSFSLQDRHWDWYKKTCHHVSDQYRWFFLMAEDKPQGVCLIHHPKSSHLTNNKIFYIEYLAVAPWNRDSKITKKRFTGIGTRLLKCAMSYATQTLKLSPGFSLHSLEQAEGYYKYIGMTHIPTKDKPQLKFFEMPLNSAQAMVSAS